MLFAAFGWTVHRLQPVTPSPRVFFFLFLESLEPQGPDESESQSELQRWVILMHIEVVETLV